MATIRLALSDDETRACWPVMAQLRPHLDEERFVAQARRQRDGCGWRLAYVEDEGRVAAAAGFRVAECLAWGKFLYVDDLVTDAGARSAGFGGSLLDWVRDLAIAEGCDELHLDSGVQRFGAHRFYLARRMEIRSHHFSMKLR